MCNYPKLAHIFVLFVASRAILLLSLRVARVYSSHAYGFSVYNLIRRTRLDEQFGSHPGLLGPSGRLFLAPIFRRGVAPSWLSAETPPKVPAIEVAQTA